MRRRLRLLYGALKDKASLTKATLRSVAAAAATAELAVLRATTHYPPCSPPDPRHIVALLSFGRGPRTAAAALTTALSSRLLSTRHPSVALKSLLCIHLLLRHSPFILLDSLSYSLLPLSSGYRPRPHPLFLSSSFPLLAPDPVSSFLSSCVRWYSRFLEVLLLLPATATASTSTDRLVDHLSSLLTPDLIAEIASLSDLIAEAFRSPDTPTAAATTRLVTEVLRLVAEDRLTAEHGILARLVEVDERLGSLEFGDAVELVYVLRQIEEYRPSDAKWRDGDEIEGRFFWKEVRRVRDAVDEVVLRMEDARTVAVRRGRAGSVSARVEVRTSSESGRFASNRWVNY